MSDNPIKLWPGPCEDGRETYFALGRDIEQGWERRVGPKDSWRGWIDRPSSEVWYQVRPPAALPDPVALSHGPGDSEIVTLWGEMKGRRDLDQWERVAPNGRRWRSLSDWGGDGWGDSYPIRIRRKES